MEVKIIYEDNNVLVVDKPAGMVIHPDKNHQSNTLVDFLLEHYPQIKRVGEDILRPGIVHRLDKDTSGVLIAAKNNQAFQWLKEQFSSSARHLAGYGGSTEAFGEGEKQRKTIKTYLALVVGKPPQDKGIIKTYLARGKDKTKQKVFSLALGKGKMREAVTEYKTLKKYRDYTLLEVQPKTGRLHQIRVHLNWLGCPVAGDEKYKRKRQVCPKQLKRQFLHAVSLKIKLPNGQFREFESPLPIDLRKVLESLEIM